MDTILFAFKSILTIFDRKLNVLSSILVSLLWSRAKFLKFICDTKVTVASMFVNWLWLRWRETRFCSVENVYGFNELNEFTFKLRLFKLIKSLNKYESSDLSLFWAKLKHVKKDREENVRESAVAIFRLDKSMFATLVKVGTQDANRFLLRVWSWVVT